jgi:hypothetical protein
MKKLLILILVISQYTFADSPLTSTEFYKAYMDVPLVQKALNSKGKITDEIIKYIYADTNPLEIKLAIINAVGWKFKGLKNSRKLFEYIMKKKKYKVDFLGKQTAFYVNATSDELICYSYMKALDNYFDVSYALDVAGKALKKSPKSFAVNMIYNLIKAQGLSLHAEYCYAANIFGTLKNNPNLIMDMKKESMSFIFEYMDYVDRDCKEESYVKRNN